MKTSLKNNKPVVDIFLDGEARIIETTGNIDLQDSKVFEELQNISNKKVIDYVKKAIFLSINDESDILGIGRRFYENHPNYYKNTKENFEELLPNITYNINSNLKLNNKVSSKNSLGDTYDG